MFVLINYQRARSQTDRKMVGVSGFKLGVCGVPWGAGTMVLLTLLLCLPLTVLLQPTMPKAQELDFVVLETCVPKEQEKTRLQSRNAYARVGCSMRMMCAYIITEDGRDYCSEKRTTDLTVEPTHRINTPETMRLIEDRLIVLNKSKCSLTVEFQNMTTDMAGGYDCKDAVNSPPRPRTVDVGYPPKQPQNISVIYTPRHSIRLRLDPVKLGRELNALETTWIIQYKWINKEEKAPYQNCTGRPKNRKCKKLDKDGICEPCIINLKKYTTCGQYTGFGIINDNIIFRIKVLNRFGEIEMFKNVNILDWVKPNAVQSLTSMSRSQSSINVSVTPSTATDMTHLSQMPITNPHHYTLQWSVGLVAARDQSLLTPEGKNFSDKYGFVRNLEDDVAALNQTVVAAFPRFSTKLAVTSPPMGQCPGKVTNQNITITDLPFPGYLYKISVQMFARYASKKVFLDTSMSQTLETEPMEGPELHDNFYHCVDSQVGSNVTCYVYWKEIPRSRRGGLVEYLITATPLHNNSRYAEDKCTHTPDPIVKRASGQANTVVFDNLDAGGVYNVSVMAFNAGGNGGGVPKVALVASTSWNILHVQRTPLPTTPRNIVLETRKQGSDWEYNLYWAHVQSPTGLTTRLYVHRCNATSPRHNQSHVPGNYICMTNMASTLIDKDLWYFTFRERIRTTPHIIEPLTPAFFVSTVTSDGTGSGLQSVDCFYKMRINPDKVKNLQVHNALDDPHVLKVTFNFPCGTSLSYAHGRPNKFAISVQKVEEGESCLQMCHAMKIFHERMLSPKDDLKKPLSYVLDNLESGTAYCVGVSLASRGSNFIQDSWHCESSRTEEEKQIIVFALPLVGIIIIAVLVSGLVYLRRSYVEAKKKFLPVHTKLLSQITITEYAKLESSLLSVFDGGLKDPESGIDRRENPRYSLDRDSSVVAEHEISYPHGEAGRAENIFFTDVEGLSTHQMTQRLISHSSQPQRASYDDNDDRNDENEDSNSGNEEEDENDSESDNNANEPLISNTSGLDRYPVGSVPQSSQTLAVSGYPRERTVSPVPVYPRESTVAPDSAYPRERVLANRYEVKKRGNESTLLDHRHDLNESDDSDDTDDSDQSDDLEESDIPDESDISNGSESLDLRDIFNGNESPDRSDSMDGSDCLDGRVSPDCGSGTGGNATLDNQVLCDGLAARNTMSHSLPEHTQSPSGGENLALSLGNILSAASSLPASPPMPASLHPKHSLNPPTPSSSNNRNPDTPQSCYSLKQHGEFDRLDSLGCSHFDSTSGNTNIPETIPHFPETITHLPQMKTNLPETNSNFPETAAFSAETNTADQLNIQHILQAANNNKDDECPTTGGDASGSHVRPVCLQTILMAAEFCPWRHTDVGEDSEGATAVLDHVNRRNHRDSVGCAGCESGFDTDSAKDTDADSLTENAV